MKFSKKSNRISATFTATLRVCIPSAGRSALKSAKRGKKLLRYWAANPAEIIFTGCGTESDNTAIKGTLAAHPNRRKVITTRVEHPAVLSVCRDLENQGYTLVELSVDKKGRLDLSELESHLDDNTAIVTIMFANNETGTVFPIQKIAEMVKAKDIVFHTDAVQAVGKIPINLSKSNIDLLSLSGHKLHAPKGVGILYVRKGTRLAPFMLGGHQEGGRRAGTENVPGIIGLGRACELAMQNFDQENTKSQVAPRQARKRQFSRNVPIVWSTATLKAGCPIPAI